MQCYFLVFRDLGWVFGPLSGLEELTRSSLEGVSNRAPFLLIKMGVLQADFSSLILGFLEASKKANLSFKSPSPKPHLNRTGSSSCTPNSNKVDMSKVLFLPCKLIRNNRKVGTASLRSRTCTKRNVGVRCTFQGSVSVCYISKWEIDTYQKRA